MVKGGENMTFELNTRHPDEFIIELIREDFDSLGDLARKWAQGWTRFNRDRNPREWNGGEVKFRFGSWSWLYKCQIGVDIQIPGFESVAILVNPEEWGIEEPPSRDVLGY